MKSPTHHQTPLNLTISDIAETRHTQPSQHMHWPVDEETRRRLRKVVLHIEERLPWQRRVLRWLKGTR